MGGKALYIQNCFLTFNDFSENKNRALFAYAKLFSNWMNLYNMFIKNILFTMAKCKLIGLLTLKNESEFAGILRETVLRNEVSII